MMSVGYAFPASEAGSICSARQEVIQMPASVNHSAFLQPNNPSCTLWRYMNVSKLIDLLTTRSLWFTRLDMLDDPFEGASPQVMEERIRALEQERYNGDKSTFVRLQGASYHARESLYVNCWCMKHGESEALWRLYGSNEGGVALRATYSRLAESLPDGSKIGVVRYVDYAKVKQWDGNLFSYAMHKRIAFEHESEVRVVTLPPTLQRDHLGGERSPRGYRVPIDLSNAIDMIVISPYTPKWVSDAIENMLRELRVDIPVFQSEMSVSPFYEHSVMPKEAWDKMIRLAQEQTNSASGESPSA